MKTLKWNKLNLPTHPELDEMMITAYDVINLEVKVKGYLTDETKEIIAPAFAYCNLIEKKMNLELSCVTKIN